MFIGVVFEVAVSALAVLGIFALVCEIDRWHFCRRKYFIALPADKFADDEKFGVNSARRVASASTGAEQDIVLLFDGIPNECEMRKIGNMDGVRIYLRYRE